MAGKDSACHCEKSVLASCMICHEKGHISASTGLCIVCITGESSEDRTEPFIMHDLKCPLAEYIKDELTQSHD